MDMILKFLLIIIKSIIINTINAIISSINSMNFIGTIPDWISAIFSMVAGVYIPIKLYNLGKNDEKLRKIENEQNDIKNQKLLSIERCGKLFSSPLINKDSYINIYNYENELPNVCEILKDDCIMSENEYTNNYLNCILLRISIPLMETKSINISEFLIEEIDILKTRENTDNSKFFHINLDNKYKKTFIKNKDIILNVYIVLDKKDYFLKLLTSKEPLIIVLKLKVKNPFNIQTYETLNAKIIFNNEIKVNGIPRYSYIIKYSAIQIDSITDENR